MADALGAVDDFVHELKSMPGVEIVPVHEDHVLQLLVTLASYDEYTWDHIIDRTDDLARTFGDEITISLRMTLAA